MLYGIVSVSNARVASWMGESQDWPPPKGDCRIEPSGKREKDMVEIVIDMKLNWYY